MQSRSKLVKATSIAIIIVSPVLAILTYTLGDNGSAFMFALMAIVFSVGEVVDRRRERRAD